MTCLHLALRYINMDIEKDVLSQKLLQNVHICVSISHIS